MRVNVELGLASVMCQIKQANLFGALFRGAGRAAAAGGDDVARAVGGTARATARTAGRAGGGLADDVARGVSRTPPPLPATPPPLPAVPPPLPGTPLVRRPVPLQQPPPLPAAPAPTPPPVTAPAPAIPNSPAELGRLGIVQMNPGAHRELMRRLPTGGQPPVGPVPAVPRPTPRPTPPPAPAPTVPRPTPPAPAVPRPAAAPPAPTAPPARAVTPARLGGVAPPPMLPVTPRPVDPAALFQVQRGLTTPTDVFGRLVNNNVTRMNRLRLTGGQAPNPNIAHARAVAMGIGRANEIARARHALRSPTRSAVQDDLFWSPFPKQAQSLASLLGTAPVKAGQSFPKPTGNAIRQPATAPTPMPTPTPTPAPATAFGSAGATAAPLGRVGAPATTAAPAVAGGRPGIRGIGLFGVY